MTASPLSSRPDSSTLMGTNESSPNSMSWGRVIFVSSRFKPAESICNYKYLRSKIYCICKYGRKHDASGCGHLCPNGRVCALEGAKCTRMAAFEFRDAAICARMAGCDARGG